MQQWGVEDVWIVYPTITQSFMIKYSCRIALRYIFYKTLSPMHIRNSFNNFGRHPSCRETIEVNLNSSDAGDGIFRLGGQYHTCWCSGSYSRQNISRHDIGCIGQSVCIFVPELISFTCVKAKPRYDSKCEYIFCNLWNNLACYEYNINHSNSESGLHKFAIDYKALSNEIQYLSCFRLIDINEYIYEYILSIRISPWLWVPYRILGVHQNILDGIHYWIGTCQHKCYC